jgi:uncharacterized Zn-finger protein
MTHSSAPPCLVTTQTVRCDGANGKDVTAGHPAVYLPVGDESAQCPYCGRVFIYDKNKQDL